MIPPDLRKMKILGARLQNSLEEKGPRETLSPVENVVRWREEDHLASAQKRVPPIGGLKAFRRFDIPSSTRCGFDERKKVSLRVHRAAREATGPRRFNSVGAIKRRGKIFGVHHLVKEVMDWEGRKKLFSCWKENFPIFPRLGHLTFISWGFKIPFPM